MTEEDFDALIEEAKRITATIKTGVFTIKDVHAFNKTMVLLESSACMSEEELLKRLGVTDE